METLSLIKIVLRQVLGFAREEPRGVDISERAPSHTHTFPRILSPFTATTTPFTFHLPPPPSPFEIQLKNCSASQVSSASGGICSVEFAVQAKSVKGNQQLGECVTTHTYTKTRNFCFESGL